MIKFKYEATRCSLFYYTTTPASVLAHWYQYFCLLSLFSKSTFGVCQDESKTTAPVINGTRIRPKIASSLAQSVNLSSFLISTNFLLPSFSFRELTFNINHTEACSLDSYDNCAYSFMVYALGSMRDEPLPDGTTRASTDVAQCRR